MAKHRIVISDENFEFLGQFEDMNHTEALDTIIGQVREVSDRVYSSQQFHVNRTEELEKELEKCKKVVSEECGLRHEAEQKIERLENEITLKDQKINDKLRLLETSKKSIESQRTELERSKEVCNKVEAELRSTAADLEQCETRLDQSRKDLKSCAETRACFMVGIENWIEKYNEMELSRDSAYAFLFIGYLAFAAIAGFMAYKAGWVPWW